MPEFSSAEAKDILERELGMPVGNVFESVHAFDKPIAAASLGQVHWETFKASLVITTTHAASRQNKSTHTAVSICDMCVLCFDVCFPNKYL